MQVVVIGQDLSNLVQHGVDNGRFWSDESFYLYTLLWDPFILYRTGAIPILRALGEAISPTFQTLLLFAQPNTEADRSLIAEVCRHGGRVILNQPAPELLNEIDGVAVADTTRPALVSLRERWDLGSMASGNYYYPDQQPFLRLAPGRYRTLSKIGGNPDLVVTDRYAVWAGNPFSVVSSYINMPSVQSRLIGDVAALLTQVIDSLIERRPAADEQKRLGEAVDLRRDFHALGYAYLTVHELARCCGRDAVGLADVERTGVDAATQLATGDVALAQQRLAEAYKALERVNRTLQPIPAIFTDTLHGGELYPDIGYFEIDWPQHPADMLKTYLHWVKTRSYRFNVDLGATTVRELALRFPDLFAELKDAQEHKHVEFVNGSCNQPYPPLHSLESQIRQFDVGVQVWKDVFGTPPRTYASQEFGFCPQIGAILAQQGYEQAVVRVQNMGDAPTLRDEQIDWVAPSGDRLRALPSHPHKSEQQNQFTYNNLHLKLYLHQRDGLDFAVFTCLGDITYHRTMREELARVCHYAPVFGRFATFREYFDATRNQTFPERRLAMQDFNCDAGFLNIDLWPIYTQSTGDFNTNCMRSLAATNLFAAAELLDGVALCRGATASANGDHNAHWEALTHYQGHGTYIVPNYPSGAFLGGINSPRSHEVGFGVPKVAEYVGPFSSRLVKNTTGSLMDASERAAAELIEERLQAMLSQIGDEGSVLYNFAPHRRRIVTIDGAAGQAIGVGGQIVAAQDLAQDCLALVDLPSYGYTVVNTSIGHRAVPAVSDPVTVGDNYLENRTLRAEFDWSSGTLRRLLCKSTGRELLGRESGAFYCPGSAAPRCSRVHTFAAGPLRGGFAYDVELPIAGQVPCRLQVRVWLDAEQAVVDFETYALNAPELTGNQWYNHLGVGFKLAQSATQIETCHFNVLESHNGERLISPNVLLAQGATNRIVFLNEGNEFYLKKNDTISNILIVQNESARRFRYAIGVADENPLMQARLWQQPVIVVPIGRDRPGDTAQSPEQLSQVSASLVSFDSDDVELLSCYRQENGALRIRLANTTGRTIRTRLSTCLPIIAAGQTALDGDREVEQAIVDGQIAFSLRPWDIKQYSIRVQPEHSASPRGGRHAQVTTL